MTTRGGGTDEAQLGVVTVKPLAGEGVATSGVCKYCGETDGHTGQCPVVSHHLGVLALWFCKSCTTIQHQGRFPCRECCGYTASAKKAVRGVKTAHGQLNARCLP